RRRGARRRRRLHRALRRQRRDRRAARAPLSRSRPAARDGTECARVGRALVLESLRDRGGRLRARLQDRAVNVALLGNYAPDRQESMLRYTALLASGLSEAGHNVTVAAPRQVLNHRGRPASGLWKWLGYLDKYGVGLADVAAATRAADVVHVCDHGNATYVPRASARPWVVTCHDLLAVRGALGEETARPAALTGRSPQRRVLSGLGRAAR